MTTPAPLDPNCDLTVGVLGTGRMARIHLDALQKLGQQGLTVGGVTWPVRLAIGGRDPAKVTELARTYQPAIVADSLEELIDHPDVQVIDNCLVNAMHFAPLMRAVRRGKHVFSDKPLTVELRQAEALLAAAREAGVQHGIVQNMRFQPGPVRAKELIDRGELGRIFHVRVTFGYFVPEKVTNRPAWFYQKDQAGGGIVLDLMSHFFDLLRHTVGPIERVYCETMAGFPEREDAAGRRFASDLEDATVVTIRFRSGAIADVFASWVRRKHEEVPLFEVDGERGSLLFSFNELKLQAQGASTGFTWHPTAKQADDQGWQSIPLEPADPFGTLWRSFLAGVVTGKPSKPDWEDAVETMRLIAAAYESARTGRAVRVVP
jgi:predicted dehydrogenase